jgi:hypothetical protein
MKMWKKVKLGGGSGLYPSKAGARKMIRMLMNTAKEGDSWVMRNFPGLRKDPARLRIREVTMYVIEYDYRGGFTPEAGLLE